jgi:hypothetical protein
VRLPKKGENKMKTINLIYIGDKFYRESSTRMSSIYTEKFQRYDWGFVQRDLQEGKTVNIRPANTIEMAIAENELKLIKQK